jgi:excisionase family DNA binding protein
MESDEILVPEQVAQLLQIPLQLVYRKTMMGQKEIPHFKVGKYLRFSKNAVLKHFGYPEPPNTISSTGVSQ